MGFTFYLDAAFEGGLAAVTAIFLDASLALFSSLIALLGCYSWAFLIALVLCLATQSCLNPFDPMDCSPPGSSVLGDSSGKNIGVGCYDLLQGIFPTQGSNTGLLHRRQILSCLSHQGSPRTLEWVVYPFSRGSSWPRNRTGVSCIVGKFLNCRLPGKRWLLLAFILATATSMIASEICTVSSFFLSFFFLFRLVLFMPSSGESSSV